MKSTSWEAITQAYEDLGRNAPFIRQQRTKGMQQVLNLIPLLRQSEILETGIRYLSLYNLVFEVPEKRAQVRILPPGPIFTGSDTEFEVTLTDSKSDHILAEQRISSSSLEDIVKITEDYFTQLKNDETIP